MKNEKALYFLCVILDFFFNDFIKSNKLELITFQIASKSMYSFILLFFLNMYKFSLYITSISSMINIFVKGAFK